MTDRLFAILWSVAVIGGYALAGGMVGVVIAVFALGVAYWDSPMLAGAAGAVVLVVLVAPPLSAPAIIGLVGSTAALAGKEWAPATVTPAGVATAAGSIGLLVAVAYGGFHIDSTGVGVTVLAVVLGGVLYIVHRYERVKLGVLDADE